MTLPVPLDFLTYLLWNCTKPFDIDNLAALLERVVQSPVLASFHGV
jgi:hypothetical protein